MSADQWRRWESEWRQKRRDEKARKVAELYWQMVRKAWKDPPEDIRFQREVKDVGATPTSK